MALTKNSKITATDINSLKSDLNKEMARRKYTGSLTKYGAGTSYDFTASQGSEATISQYNNIIIPMRAVNASTVGETTGSAGKTMVSLSGIAEILDSFEGKSLTASSSDCKTACSGLCHTACHGNCKGCSGCSGCGGSCETDCTGCSGCGGCGNSCSGCSGSCKGGCSGGCESDGCSRSCVPNCAVNVGAN